MIQAPVYNPAECTSRNCTHMDLCRRFGRHLEGPLLQAAQNIVAKKSTPAARIPLTLRHECRHLGERLPGQPCGSTLHRCGYDGITCSRFVPCKDAARVCASCEFHTPYGRQRIWKFDETNLHPGWPGKRFNPSLIEYGNGYLLAWRHGWAGCEIYLSRLDWDFKPMADPVQLHLQHPAAVYGREDGRLFWHRGQLHITFTGVMNERGSLHTNVLYAPLDDRLRVERVYFPRITGRLSWEKNHAYFECDGRLYTIYGYQPHRILAIDGDYSEWAHSTPSPATWTVKGEIRGGASPVLIGSEYWHWFHSREETPGGRRYCLGVYTFSPRPPFEVKRLTTRPLLWADFGDKPADQYCAAVFPCGAVRQGSRWLVSMGVHDRWGEVWEFDHNDVLAQLASGGA